MSVKKFAILLIAMLLLAGRANAAPAKAIAFNRDIRPILAENCYTCHGVEKQKGNLRLDQRDAAIKSAKSGKTAINPNHPDTSELVARIASKDAEEQMPPPDSGKKLSDVQIELLKTWIAQGAEYQPHWAFTPPIRAALPAVQDEKWCRNAIDRFILARLEVEGMNPSPEADKVTLLRRLHLDLTGLPPTPKEVDAFLADDSPAAYEKQVDRLLASPHYGERWGRHWLDTARYADSDGFEKDKQRTAWHYRDYVISAFNADLPYDQFIIEQLAGDQLPRATQDQIVATGYLRNSMLNEEAGVDPEQFRMDAMFDRMDAIGKGILGLTIQCAQCHSHKSDPLTQREYYRMFAFLNNDHESQRIVYTPEEFSKIAELQKHIREIETALQKQSPDWENEMAKWESQVTNDPTQWIVVPLENVGDNAQRYILQPDGSYLAQGNAPANFTASFRWTSKLPPITAIRLELLTDPNLPRSGPGRSTKGTCALSEFTIDTAPATDPTNMTSAKFSAASSDFDQPQAPLEPQFDDHTGKPRMTGPAKFAIDGDDTTAWGIEAGPARRNQNRQAVFNLAAPIISAQATFPKPSGTILTFNLKQNHGGPAAEDLVTNNLGRFRISLTIDTGAVAADPLPRRVRDILRIKPARRTPFQRAALFSYWRTTIPAWKEPNTQIQTLYNQWPEGSTALTLTPRDEPRTTSVLTRGDWLLPTDKVNPAVPAFLNSLPADAEPSRLTFARWLVDRQAPTTARAFMNRVWQAYFGTGIVATPEDLGTTGASPTHPELLDYLACEFMGPSTGSGRGSDWHLKQMHRLIVTSATYRQSSAITPEAYNKDPFNHLLARGARFRVEGEIVRDIALAASGLLNPKIGGRSVMPPAPASLFKPPSSFAPFAWIDETTDEKYRRALYTFRRRTTPYPMLQAFDVPNADTACVRRQLSNSPLQALTLLNEQIFVDCAKALARKALEESPAADNDRIIYAFRLALSRSPSPTELIRLTALLQKEQEHFDSKQANPQLIIDAVDLPKSVTISQLAAYTVIARVILNLDETITRE